MISTLKTGLGYVYAYIEWEVVNKFGRFENGGEYIYVQNCWIHETQRFGQVLCQLAEMIYEHPYSQEATNVYWDVFKDEENRKVLEEEDRDQDGIIRQHLHNKDKIIKKLRSKYEYIPEIVSMQI